MGRRTSSAGGRNRKPTGSSCFRRGAHFLLSLAVPIERVTRMSNRTILTILTVVLALGVAEGVEAARDIYLIRVASAIGPGITEFVEREGTP